MINEEKITRKCEVRGLKCQFGNGVIYINSGISDWRLFHNGERVTKVMHANYRGLQYNNGKFKSGFHEQKLWNLQINNILNYISKHDQRFLNPVRNDYDRMYNRANQRIKIA